MRGLIPVETRIAIKSLLVPETGCLLWQGATSGDGVYPIVYYQGKCVSVRRLVFERATGIDPAGTQVLDTCGNRNCVNPDHLALRHDDEDGMIEELETIVGQFESAKAEYLRLGRLRVEAIVKAKNSGHTERRIGRVCGVSGPRIHAIIAAEEA